MGKIKIGVFGAGRGRTMIDFLTQHPELAQLVAVCDKYQPSLDECAKSAQEKGMKVELYTDFEKFFQCDMDAVVLANYANEHAPFAIRLLESGRHVISEVLACATLDEGLRLAEAVEKSGKIYHYAENYCFFRATAEMRRRYRLGDIGELTYAEGEYLHDCTCIWPAITYGQRNHWRNNCSSTFYCTHAAGPIMHACGLRPVKVTGFETRVVDAARNLGMRGASHGIIMVEFENHALLKAAQGLSPKRTPESINYEMYGERGMFETDRHQFDLLHTYIEENGRNGDGVRTNYTPMFQMDEAYKSNFGHGGSDFFPMYYFIRAIEGDEHAKEEAVDVYEAIDMTLPGILAHKSIMAGGIPFEQPNIRDRVAREVMRGDTFCTYKEIGGAMTVPPCSTDDAIYPDEVYDHVRELWENHMPG